MLLHPAFYIGHGDPHVCLASTLPTKPAPCSLHSAVFKLNCHAVVELNSVFYFIIIFAVLRVLPITVHKLDKCLATELYISILIHWVYV